MIHHDKRDYDVAVSEAAKHFQQKLEKMVHGSVDRVKNVIEQVERDIPEDALVAAKKLEFTATENGIALVPPAYEGNVNPGPWNVHKHAFEQLCEKANIRHLVTVMKDLQGKGEWGRNLVAENLSEIYHNQNGQRLLLRRVGDQVRGVLSDSYRRLDSRPLLEAFVNAIQAYGARPLDGFALQTKISVRAVLPIMFEPVRGEVMAFGVELGDSDFGDGKLFVAGFVDRMYCTNLARLQDVLSQVHLGRKLSDSVVFSRETIELDTRTYASAIKDVVGSVLAPASINKYLGLVREASEQKMDTDAIHAWAKKNLTKAETDAAVSKFNSADIELLPAGQTKWRWSNALSWLANETKDEHRRLDLQEFAGALIK